MRKATLVIGAVFLVCGWLAFWPIAFFNSGFVSGWMGFLPASTQESFVFNLLGSDNEPAYKKTLLLEAWLADLQSRERRFYIADFTRLIPITKIGGEALNEPIGLTAARVIIESGDCAAIGRLLAFYHTDEQATKEISKRLVRTKNDCPAIGRMPHS